MKHRARTATIVILGATSLIAGAALMAFSPIRRDPFRFLEGRPLVHTAIQGPGSWGPQEYRFYSWKEDWQVVAARVRTEMPTWGMKELSKKPDWPEGVTWVHKIIDGGLSGSGSDLTVEVVPGRANRPSMRTPMTNKDPSWVTVVVVADAEDNLLNIIRYTIAPIPD